MRRASGPNPKTERLSPDRYRLGVEIEYINANYSEILANGSATRHRDLKTGKYDGIESNVKPDSIAASHGVSRVT